MLHHEHTKPVAMRRIAFPVVAALVVACGQAPDDDPSTGGEPTSVPDASSAGEHSIVVMAPDEGDVLWSFPESAEELGSGGELQMYVDARTHPEASASFAKYTLGVSGALPVHKHEKTEEFAYILSGRGAAVQVDESGRETELPIHDGYVWYNPRGIWHSVRNEGDEPLVLVFATVPNEAYGLLSFFREISVEPAQEGRPITMEELERLGAEHDMNFVEPRSEAIRRARNTAVAPGRGRG